MFGNYLKIALRNAIRNKIHSIINTAGLVIGLVCFILIMMWIRDELNYDKFHEHGEQIYQIIQANPVEALRYE
jgi:putative ABC transport system permease protein